MPHRLSRRILVLGGTSEASELARLLAAHGLCATLSYAGRTENPRAQPIPTRVGGFGGVEGLAAYLRAEGITHLVDATHPFAATMSANACAAAQLAGVPLVALTRPAWEPQEDDRWREVATIAQAVDALAGAPRRVFLALGRQHVEAFAAQPQHRYVLRFVDAPGEAPALPDHALVVDRGPFTVAGDRALMETHGIECIVAKNAGGSGAQAKLEAARALGLPVIMIARPALPPRVEVHRAADVLDWLDHAAPSGAERGV